MADDHPIVRDGLRGAFAEPPDIEVVGEAANGRDAVTEALRLRVDVVLMDLRMPQVSGVEAITALAGAAPSTRARYGRTSPWPTW
ncbi:response regulator transcription factor [Solwaraspora sp. WMMD937]|nr:response regulator transcription factor [Solwaraspora sp. WMMD937]WFE24755.1 response regulator transcription factor [Solwaraspora sp. WMMD937]